MLREHSAFDAVLFDLDDTLHDRSAAFRRWTEEFVATRLRLMEERAMAETIEWLISLDEGGYGSKPHLFGHVLARFPDAFAPGTSAPALVEEFHPALVSHIHLNGGTLSLLDSLTDRGIPFGIITNGSTRQQARKIAHLGLDKRTSCLLISEAYGVKKPHSAIFRAAAEQLGRKPERTLFVGDHPRNDIWGARQVGMKTGWLARGQEWPANDPTLGSVTPDFVLNSLTDILPLLERD